MKIAITGSTGFIGGRLASAFASAGAEVTAFGRKPDIRFPEENITYVRWDMRERICSVSKDREIDVFVHSAANTNWKDPVSTLVADNEKTVSNVLEAASRAKHVILVSTSSVYQGIHWTLSENLPLDVAKMRNWYALSKYSEERAFLKSVGAHQKLTILRPRAVYGAGDRLLVPGMLRSSAFWRLCLFWRGDFFTSITSIGTFVESVFHLIESQVGLREIYNVSDPDPVKIVDIFREVAGKYGKSWLLHLPLAALGPIGLIRPSIGSYYADLFGWDKVLDISKLQSTGFASESKDFRAHLRAR